MVVQAEQVRLLLLVHLLLVQELLIKVMMVV